MEKNFAIEIEVNEAERKNYIEKLRNLFLGKGFIVEREWEDNIELIRPVSRGQKGEVFIYPWIDKIYIEGKSGSVIVNCSIKNYVWIRNLILFGSPIIDVFFLLFLFYSIPNYKMIIIIAFFLIFSNITAYFVFDKQFKNMMSSLSEEIQNLN